MRLVWMNITQNKFKTIMTSIGIIVGAATIVMVIAIGKGGKEDVADQFKNLNAGAIDISYDGGNSNEKSSSDDGGGGGMGMPSGGAPGGAPGEIRRAAEEMHQAGIHREARMLPVGIFPWRRYVFRRSGYGRADESGKYYTG